MPFLLEDQREVMESLVYLKVIFYIDKSCGACTTPSVSNMLIKFFLEITSAQKTTLFINSVLDLLLQSRLLTGLNILTGLQIFLQTF